MRSQDGIHLKLLLMHRSLVTGLCCLLCFFAAAQKFDWHARVGTGVFFFTGASAVKTQTPYGTIGSISSKPYGKQSGLVVSAGTSARLLIKKFFLAISLECQRVSAYSKIDSVTTIDAVGPPVPTTYKVEDGRSTFKGTTINLVPSIGFQQKVGKHIVSIAVGPEWAFYLHSEQHLKFNYIGTNTKEDKKKDNLNHPNTDLRMRFSLGWQINKITILASYSHGVTNYYEGWAGGSPEATSHVIGLGLAYKLNK
jgi:hypothetical protein